MAKRAPAAALSEGAIEALDRLERCRSAAVGAAKGTRLTDLSVEGLVGTFIGDRGRAETPKSILFAAHALGALLAKDEVEDVRRRSAGALELLDGIYRDHPQALWAWCHQGGDHAA